MSLFNEETKTYKYTAPCDVFLLCHALVDNWNNFHESDVLYRGKMISNKTQG